MDSMDPMDYSLPGSSVHGILQARILEWVAVSFSWGSSQPRDQTQVSCIAGGSFTIWPTACQCREHTFDPWSGKIPRVMEQLSLCCSLTRETTAMRSLGTAARESLSSNEDPAQPKIKVNKFLKLFFKRATKMKRQIVFAVSLHGKAYVRYAKWPLYIIIVCKFYLYIWIKFGQFSQKEESELTNLFLKVFIEFVIIFFLFYILVFWGMWDLNFPTRVWTHNPELEGKVLTTGPREKSLS